MSNTFGRPGTRDRSRERVSYASGDRRLLETLLRGEHNLVVPGVTQQHSGAVTRIIDRGGAQAFQHALELGDIRQHDGVGDQPGSAFWSRSRTTRVPGVQPEVVMVA